jgi:vacuolar-type H+-ATPase subunit H
MDRRVNQALEEQSQRLAEMRQRKQEDLMEVYKKVRHQKYEGSSMQAR